MWSLLTKTKHSFDGQLHDESTALVLRMHWLFPLGIIVAFALLYLLPFAVFVRIGRGLSNNAALFYWFLAFIYFLVCWNGLFYRLALYVLNMWIVTDHRIIANEHHRLFHRTLAELTISKVQDVEVQVQGIIPTFFDFGNVHIQTTGEEANFLFKNVANPAAVKDAIIKAQRDYSSSHPNGKEPGGV